MLITQDFSASITQGYALAPAPSGGHAHGGSATGQQTHSVAGQYYPGGACGEPFPSPFPTGPILICWQDAATGEYCSGIMAAVEQEPDPPGAVINPGAIDWSDVLAWWPIPESELDL